MARTRRIPKRERRDPSQFVTPLSSAIYEFVLIVLLFIHALLCFVVQKFARYCKLPTPCLLCSRVDRRRAHFYKELICHAHKLEISSLAYCRSHQRLANGHEMCKGCLPADGLNANLLREKFNGEEMIKAPLLKKDLEPGSQSKRCSCCLVPLKSRPLAHKLLQIKHVTERDAASLSCMHLGNGLAKEKGDHHFERMSQTGYNELKIASESELEVPFSDDVWSLSGGVDDVKGELLSRCLQAGPAASAQDKLIHPSLVMPDTCVSIAERRLQVDASHSTMSIGHGLEEINWNKGEVKPNVLISSEILFEQVPTESLIPKLEVPDHSGFASNGDAIKVLSSADIGLRMNEKLASSIKVPCPSPASSELPNGRETSRVPEELKSRLSQISAARWLEFPWIEMSATPKGNGQGEESKLSDTSSFYNSRRPIIDRYESGVESLDGSFVSEIEGESTEDRLKRQIEMDRKFTSILYKELEEERNASAVSANQAMSMINRLQEEKAAIHMEALQYLRMMEEQTEYDQEALQKLNDLLSDRDKEIQDLEAVVESYRKQFGGEIISRVLEEPFDCEEREYTEYSPVSTPRFVRSRGRDSGKTLMRNTVLDFEDEKVHISESLRRLERKLKLYSYGSELSTKEDGFLNKNTISKDAATGNGDDLKAVVDDDQKLIQHSIAARENSQTEEMNITPSREGSLLSVSSSSSIHGPFSIRDLKERRMRSVSYNGRQFQMGGKKNEIVALGNEISQLSVRLEALEEDRNFLEHAVSSLRNGSNGIQFVQEIACHLRELRQIGIRHQEHIVA